AIAFKYPSPYNPMNYVMIFYSNSLEGLNNLIKNARLNGLDYQVINEQGVVAREGNFNKENFKWTYSSEMDNDIAEAGQSSQSLKVTSSPNFTFFYYPDSYASTKVNDIKRDYESYLKKLNVATNSEL